MYKLSQRGRVRYLEAAPLNGCSFLTHGFLTRWNGESSGKFSSLNFSIREGDREDRVARNWEVTAEAFGLNVSQFFTIHQVHGDRIVIAEDLCGKYPPDFPVQCDAVLTEKRGVAIGIKTADCVPILLVDREKHVIGAVHAGWRGTSLKIAAKVLNVLRERFNSRPRDILVAIGPAIGPCCYQVDGQVYGSFRHGDVSGKQAFRESDVKGKWMLDLVLANAMQLTGSGVPRENISAAELCTSCRTDLFFSHRAEKGGTGRQLNFIVMN